MSSPWLRLLTSFTAIAALFAAYRLGATPLLEPPRRANAGNEDPSTFGPIPVVERIPELARWFPADAWELAFPQVLETEHGMLMLKSYESLDDGRLLIKPCTMVLKASDDQNLYTAPIVLQAPEGAVLAFDKPLDLRKASVGKLVGGTLRGEIHIHRAASSDNPRLDLYTRNVQIDETRIWTTHDVNFRYGRTTGSGRDLLITLPKLLGDGASKPKKSASPIRFLELVKVERIHVDLEALQADRQPPTNPPEIRLPKSVDIFCDGPFRMDFLQQAAAFEKNVRVTLHHDGPVVDRMQCELLAAYFAIDKKPNESAAVQTGRFQLKRLVASGDPITIDAPTYKAGGKAERLEYDFEQRLLVLNDPKQVNLQHERFEIQAKGSIEYQLPETGSLGELWAGGPGRLSGIVDKNSSDRLVATWGQRLKIERQADQHLMSLEGGSSVGMASFGGIQAGQLYLWLRPAAESGSSNRDFPKLSPDRMLAQQNVIIDSPMFRGQLQRVEAWFRDAPVRLPIAAAGNRGPLLPAHSSDLRQAPEQKSFFELVGRQARLHVLKRASDYELDELSVEGSVQLTEQPKDPRQPPLTVSGEVVVLKQAQLPTATLQLVGNPAHLSARGMHLRAGEMFVDRGAGTIDIPTAGHVQVPIAASTLTSLTSLGNNASPTGRPIAPDRTREMLQPLDITWQKGAHFDGQTATISDRVELRSGLQFASADSLSVTLDRPIDFQSDDIEGREQPQVEALRLDGNVTMEQRELDERGQLASIQYASLPMLSVNQRTGAVISEGAGWFETVRYSDSLNEQQGRVPSNKPPELIHVRVHYARGIRGDLRTRSVRFFDQVQAIYGPVANWQQRLDLWRPETHGEKSFIVRCDQLDAAAITNPNAEQAFEMTALGNTSIQGRKFMATCHRISYDGRKQLLVMEGDGRRDAEVTQQSVVGGQSSKAAARQIFFSLRDQSFQVHDAKYLDLNGPFATGGF